MRFNLVDLSKWKRREYFQHYLHTVACSYSLTTNIDITRLRSMVKDNGLKLYPVLIHALASTVNRHEAFRTALDDNGNVGIWDTLHPNYTIFNRESELFCSIWTAFNPNMMSFYQRSVNDITRYSHSDTQFPQTNMPPNVFPVSSLPGVSFTAFNLNLHPVTPYLLPIFTFGKFTEQGGTTLLPLALQVHHAACDGFHVSMFIDDLQSTSDSYEVCTK